jgi:hypothetical protein
VRPLCALKVHKGFHKLLTLGNVLAISTLSTASYHISLTLIFIVPSHFRQFLVSDSSLQIGKVVQVLRHEDVWGRGFIDPHRMT